MSIQALRKIIADLDKVKSFNSLEQAKEYFDNFRDHRLKLISEISSKYSTFKSDYTPESLKDLEKLYFSLYENEIWKENDLSREMFEECLAVYFGAVVVKNNDQYYWNIEKFSLGKDKYHLYITKKLSSLCVERFPDYYKTPNNKTKSSLYRKYKTYN